MIDHSPRPALALHSPLDLDSPQAVHISMDGFFRAEAGLGIDLEAGVTKMVAGDYCCFHVVPAFTRSEDLLRAAIGALETQVGAVVVKERMQESLEVCCRAGGAALTSVGC